MTLFMEAAPIIFNILMSTCIMMSPWHGNAFGIISPLWMESFSHRLIHHTLRSVGVFGTPRRVCGVTIMLIIYSNVYIHSYRFRWVGDKICIPQYRINLAYYDVVVSNYHVLSFPWHWLYFISYWSVWLLFPGCSQFLITVLKKRSCRIKTGHIFFLTMVHIDSLTNQMKSPCSQ